MMALRAAAFCFAPFVAFFGCHLFLLLGRAYGALSCEMITTSWALFQLIVVWHAAAFLSCLDWQWPNLFGRHVFGETHSSSMRNLLSLVWTMPYRAVLHVAFLRAN